MISINRQAITELLREMVRAPSHPGVPRQEEKTVAVLADYLHRHGIAVTMTEVRAGRPNLLATIKTGSSDKHLLWCGHTDTVPPNKISAMDPFAAEIRDGRMFGRGTVDMKGALAAMAGALVALSQSSVLKRGEVSFAAVIDEEMESLGAEALIQSGVTAEGAIIGEPTQNLIAIGHKGLEWLEVEFIGKATHGGTAQRGVNAISAASRFVRLIEDELVPQLSKRRHSIIGSPTLNFGVIHGGDQPSTVAAECKVQLDRRWLPSESVDMIFSELENMLAKIRQLLPGLDTAIRRVPGGMATMIHAPLETAADHPLVNAAQRARQEVCGEAGELTAFPAWTDAALFSQFGKTPCLVCGPGDLALAHSAEESIALEEVYQAAEIYARTAIHFLNDEK
jgi:acetylornithine deacetylase/succinyl-diaminopimelate desuccinylase